MQADAEILALTQGRNVIVFDGVCVFCNAWVAFVLKHDRQQEFSFVVAQSDLGEMLYSRLGLKSNDYDTFIVITDGQIGTSLDGVLTVLRRFGWPWRAFSIAGVLPKFAKDAFYNLIARNRYRLFGRREACMIPPPQDRARFIDL